MFSAHGIRTEVDVEVRKLEPPHAVDIHLRAKQFEAEYKGFVAKAAAPMITRQAQGSLERSLRTLKSLVEGS